MARDIFVYFEEDEMPQKRDIEQSLGDYVNGIGEVEWKRGAFIVSINGRGAHPASNLPARPDRLPPEKIRESYQADRWFEVHLNLANNNIDVLTRTQDELVNAIATGYAQWASHWWKGRLG